MTSHPVSRRERPSKPALSREWVISAALEIVRTEGLEKVTMRRVAQVLDTGPASLYVYVRNTAELHGAVLDELLSPLAVRGELAWEQGLEQMMRDYAKVLFQFPGLARSALVLPPTGPNAIRLFDQVFGRLLDGGIEPARAAWGADLLIQVVTGVAAEHSAPAATDVDAPSDPESDWRVLKAAVRDVDAAWAPHISAHADTVLSGTPTERFAWTVRTLITGIAGTPVPNDRG